MKRKFQPNHSTRTARHWIALDCETTPRAGGDGKDTHLLWHAQACHFTVENGRAKRQNWASFDDGRAVWEWILSRLQREHTTWLVCHYAAYDLTASGLWLQLEKGKLRPRRVARRGTEDDQAEDEQLGPPGLLCMDDPPVILDLESADRRRLVCVDLMNWFPCPLSEVAQSLGRRAVPLPGDAASDDDWAAKCRADVETVRDAVVALCRWVREGDLGVMRYTAASQALAAWRHGRMDCPIAYSTEAAYKALERAAYHPGLTRAHFVGKGRLRPALGYCQPRRRRNGLPVLAAGPFARIDCNACYPFVMGANDFPVGLLSTHGPMDSDRAVQLLEEWEGVARVSLYSPRVPYPVKQDGRTRWVRGRVHTALCGPDLRAALAAGHVTAVHEMHCHARGRPFKTFTAHLLSLRDRYRSEGNPVMAKLCKTTANALHGKFGQWAGGWRLIDSPCPPVMWGTYLVIDGDTGEWHARRAIGGHVQQQLPKEEKADNYPLIAAYTAAYARQLVRRAVEVAGQGEVPYQDCDSLHVGGVGFGRLAEAGWIDDHEPGKFKLEAVANSAQWFGPKHYQLGEQLVRAGVSPRAWRDEEGTMRQRHFLRMRTLINGDPPDGPVTEDVPCPEPTPHNDGVFRPDGWLDYPVVDG